MALGGLAERHRKRLMALEHDWPVRGEGVAAEIEEVRSRSRSPPALPRPPPFPFWDLSLLLPLTLPLPFSMLETGQQPASCSGDTTAINSQLSNKTAIHPAMDDWMDGWMDK